MRSVVVLVGPIALAFGAMGGVACGSFSAAEQASPPDAAADAAPDAPPTPATCDEPTFVDDPGAQPDSTCDGVKVDLTTSPEHCGACDHACTGCDRGLCPKDSVEGVSNAAVATVAGSALYVASKAGTVARAGGDPFSPPLGAAPARLGADATSVWAATADKLIRFDVGNGVGDIVPGVTTSRFVVGDTAIFYVAAGHVVKLPKVNAPSSTVQAAGATAVATFGDDAFWTATATDGNAMAIVGPFSSPKELATASAIATLSVDDEHVYFADATTNEVRRVRRMGGSTQRVTKDVDGSIEGLHADGPFLYWASNRKDHYALVRARKCGGLPVVLIDDLGALTQLSTDARFVYAAELLTGTVRRVAK